MSQFNSFFIPFNSTSSNTEELNNFCKSHIIIRIIENLISSGPNAGIQLLIEYRNVGDGSGKQKQKIDWRETLKTEKEKQIFDKLKSFRLNLSKQNQFKAAFMVCTDEHLTKIIQTPNISLEEIMNFPHSSVVQIERFANDLLDEYKRILEAKNLKVDNIPTEIF